MGRHAVKVEQVLGQQLRAGGVSREKWGWVKAQRGGLQGLF